jgi:hypothetical protein
MASRVLAAVFPWFERLGLHVVRNHFYSPIPDTRRLDDTVFTQKGSSDLTGQLGSRALT